MGCSTLLGAQRSKHESILACICCCTHPLVMVNGHQNPCRMHALQRGQYYCVNIAASGDA